MRILANIACLAALVVVSTVTACTTRPQSLAPNDAGALTTLSAEPGLAGALEYRGFVRDIDSQPAAVPVFTYERRTKASKDTLASTHVTRDREGHVAVLHVAEHGPDYSLRSFRLTQAQTGAVGRLDVGPGGRLKYRLRQGQRERQREEAVGLPVVVGPTLYGFVREHWHELQAGEVQRIVFPDLERMRSYEFELKLEDAGQGRAKVIMRARRALVRLAIRPMEMIFDTETLAIVSYRGRVPPLLAKSGGMVAWDAEVHYEYAQ